MYGDADSDGTPNSAVAAAAEAPGSPPPLPSSAGMTELRRELLLLAAKVAAAKITVENAEAAVGQGAGAPGGGLSWLWVGGAFLAGMLTGGLAVGRAAGRRGIAS